MTDPGAVQRSPAVYLGRLLTYPIAATLVVFLFVMPPSVRAQSSGGVSVLSFAEWPAPIDALMFVLVVRNAADLSTGPFVILAAGTDCATAGRGDPVAEFNMTQRVANLGPGEDAIGVWLPGVECGHYRVGVEGQRLVDASLALQPSRAGAVCPTSGFGDNSNWTAPWGGGLPPDSLGISARVACQTMFTSGSSGAVVAGVTWSAADVPGFYRLAAFIPRHGPLNGLMKRDASQARYTLMQSGQPVQTIATIDQEAFSNEFAYLGRVALDQSSSVQLGDDVRAPASGATWVLFSVLMVVPDVPDGTGLDSSS